MKEEYEIIYDYCDPESDFNSAHNLCEHFEGTWSELQDEIKKMKKDGCYNFDITSVTQDENIAISDPFYEGNNKKAKADVLADTVISMIGLEDAFYAVLDELSDEQKEDILSRVIEKAEKDMGMKD